MLRPKLVKNGASGAGQLSGVVVGACLILGWSRPAFPAESTAPPDEKPHLQLAPIKMSTIFSGNIDYTFERFASNKGSSIMQTLSVDATAGIRASSFIWQPWLAQVSGQLLGTVGTTNRNSSSTLSYNTLNTNINGDAALNLVRSSRFPFEARIFRKDNNYSSSYSGTNSVMKLTGYNLNQGYTSSNRRLKINAFFTNQKSSGPNFSPSYSDLFNADLVMQLTRTQSISINGSSNSDKQPALGQSYLRNALLATHAYQPNSIFSWSSQADMFKMEQVQMQGSSTSRQDFDAGQFTSFASWRPENNPITVTSSVRLYNTNSSSNGISAPTLTNSNFNLGANYLFSPLIRLYGAVNVNDSLGTQYVNTAAALTAAKRFTNLSTNTANISGFRYSQHIGGTISTSNTTILQSTNQTNVQASNLNLNLGVNLGHALDKASQVGSGSLATNLHQTISMRYSPVGPIPVNPSNPNGSSRFSISTLNTGGSLTWNRSEGRETTILRLSANDSRNLNGEHQIFQMINLQAGRSQAISSQESLQGNLTVQATHQETAYLQDIPDTVTPSANLNYRNLRTFKVRNLMFESLLRISNPNIARGFPYNQSTSSWENNFGYLIGRLTLRLETRLDMIGNNTLSLIRFRLSRPF